MTMAPSPEYFAYSTSFPSWMSAWKYRVAVMCGNPGVVRAVQRGWTLGWTARYFDSYLVADSAGGEKFAFWS